MSTNAKIIVGFLLGTAIGTITGLLMAPATGTRTRKNINRKAKKIVKQLEGMIGLQTGKPKRKLATASAHVKNGRASVSSR
jgi:gas vesicle protein